MQVSVAQEASIALLGILQFVEELLCKAKSRSSCDRVNPCLADLWTTIVSVRRRFAASSSFSGCIDFFSSLWEPPYCASRWQCRLLSRVFFNRGFHHVNPVIVTDVWLFFFRSCQLVRACVLAEHAMRARTPQACTFDLLSVFSTVVLRPELV